QSRLCSSVRRIHQTHAVLTSAPFRLRCAPGIDSASLRSPLATMKRMCSSRPKGGEPKKTKEENQKMINTTQNNQIPTSWQLAQASVNSLADAIQSGRNEALFTYLQTMAKFPTYSARNVLLIAAQRPTATHLEGVRSWNDLGRSVRPGEKGIRIFAPTVGIKPDSQSQDAAKTSRKRKKQ